MQVHNLLVQKCWMVGVPILIVEILGLYHITKAMRELFGEWEESDVELLRWVNVVLVPLWNWKLSMHTMWLEN